MAKTLMDINKLANRVTIRVRIIGIRQFTAKLWIAKQLLKLAACISGMNIRFEDDLLKADIV